MKPGRKPNSPPAHDPGPKPTLVWLPVHRLSVDLRYQRSLNGRRSQALIRKIAEEFSWKKFGTLSVSPMALDAYALWDGQHRVAGARLAGITDVPCSSNDAPTMEEQAALFIAANKDRVAVHSFAMHHAQVAAGNQDHVAIAGACTAADVEIVRYPIPATSLKPNQTLAIGTIKQTIRLRGAEIAIDTMRLLRQAYPGIGGALRAHLIAGIATVLAVDEIKAPEKIITGLKDLGLRGIERRIQDVMTETGDAKAQALVGILRDLLGNKPRTNSAGLPKVSPAKIAPPSKVVALPRAAAKSGPVKMPDLKPQPAPAGRRDVTASLMGDPDPKRGRS